MAVLNPKTEIRIADFTDDNRVSFNPNSEVAAGCGMDEAALEYVKLSRANGLDPAQVAIRFTLDQKFLTSCIVGATTLEQLRAVANGKPRILAL